MNINGETIIFEGKKRFYVEDLSKRDFILENTSPHILKINEYEIIENVWGEMIKSLTKYLLNTIHLDRQKILNYKTAWSSSDIFSSFPRTNYKQVEENLYVNCNHTALHSCWVIQDLLDLFGVDKTSVYLLIYRPPTSEPKKCREYFLEKFKNEFSNYLQLQQGKSENNSNLIIKYIERSMNPILAKISPSYDSFFLFDDNIRFYPYSNNFMTQIKKSKDLTESDITKMKEHIGYLRKFYKISI